MRQKRWNPANRARMTFAIVEREVAFRRSVELENPRDLKTALEFPPHLRPQSIAASQPEAMLGFPRMRWSVDQVAAELTDILKEGTLPIDDFVPEATRRKLRSNDYRSAF